MNISPDKQQGLTLIELMISMLIGLLILLGITSMFMANKRIYTEQESMSRLQENARFAIGMLIKDIHMAGYAGCAHDITELANHLNGSGDTRLIFSFVDAVEGSENAGNWQPSNSTDMTVSIKAATDAISIRYLDPIGVRITGAMPPTSTQLDVDNTGNLVAGDIIAVTDCDSADVVQLTQVQSSPARLQHNPGTATVPGNRTPHVLQKSYGTDAEIMRFISHRYYIRNNSAGIPSLFRKSINGNDLELVEGVENMQILYGEDTSGNDRIADVYVTATAVTAWNNVVSVRLGLLLRTIDENRQIDPDNKVYDILGGAAAGGATIGPTGDYHRRRIYTTTVQIRNRRNQG